MTKQAEHSIRGRVLLVDDEPHVLASIRVALRCEAYDTLTAASAEQALELLEQQTVDVVVSDHQMPGMPGAEFVAVLRQKYPDTMRILLTGHASAETAIDAINRGEVYRFLTKPFSAVALAHVIRDALFIRRLSQDRSRLYLAATSQRALLHGNKNHGSAMAARDIDLLLEEVGRELCLPDVGDDSD